MLTKNWYVYKISFSDNSFYIGYRGTMKLVEEDFLVRYFSSSKLVKEKVKSTSYVGEILLETNDKELAYMTEQRLIYEHINDPLILNQACYYGKIGFGLLTEESLKKISDKSKINWSRENFRIKMKESQRLSWTDERKVKQSNYMKTVWTDERKADHSNKLKGHIGHMKCKGVSKSIGFGEKVSNALKGLPKTDEHKRKLSEIRKSSTVYVTRILDKQPMTLTNFNKWQKYVISREAKTNSK